jgi:uncharacterized protein (TIRG00374 family)
MSAQEPDVAQLSKPWRLWLPVLLGLAVTGVLMVRSFKPGAFAAVEWGWSTVGWLLVALALVLVRDGAYMVRIRLLSGRALSWRQSFRVIALWEFCSAVMPQALGGGFAFAMAIIHKEGVRLGKSISVVMFSSFLDGMFFAVVAPLVYVAFGKDALFSSLSLGQGETMHYGAALNATFWTIYSVVLAYKLLVAYALFINARAVKKFLLSVFGWKLLRKWRPQVLEISSDMVVAAHELKSKRLGHWLSSMFWTFVSWSARYLLINALLQAFDPSTLPHALLYARQVVMGILLVGSPVPGGAGLAELMFSNFLGPFISNAALTVALAILWRLFSYYPYLILGSLVLPKWIRRVRLGSSKN